MTPDDIRALAQRQLAGYDSHSPGAIFLDLDGAPSLTIDDAYRIQIATARLRTARGEAVAGYKIGCVSQAVRRQLGVEHAVFGHLFANEIRRSEAVLSPRDFENLAIEGEFAITLARDVPDPGVLREDPGSYVREVFPVIELHNHVCRGSQPTAVELIATNALHAGIVVPETKAVVSPGERLDIAVSLNGTQLGAATVDPFGTLHELALLLDGFGIALRRGDIVLTGSPLPLYPVNAHDRIRIGCPAIAEVVAVVGPG